MRWYALYLGSLYSRIARDGWQDLQRARVLKEEDMGPARRGAARRSAWLDSARRSSSKRACERCCFRLAIQCGHFEFLKAPPSMARFVSRHLIRVTSKEGRRHLGGRGRGSTIEATRHFSRSANLSILNSPSTWLKRTSLSLPRYKPDRTLLIRNGERRSRHLFNPHG